MLQTRVAIQFEMQKLYSYDFHTPAGPLQTHFL